MFVFTVSFALGAWLLQQQAALPDSAPIWLLPALALSLFIPQRHFWPRFARTGLIALLACGIGFHYAAWRAEQRLAVSLPGEWQGRDIELVGVVAELPRNHERGWRFVFDVERVLTPQASVPQRIYLVAPTHYRQCVLRTSKQKSRRAGWSRRPVPQGLPDGHMLTANPLHPVVGWTTR